MKVVRKIHPERQIEDTIMPARAGPNDYQYYRSYDNKWHISVVCNYAVHDYQEGYFEVGVYTYDQNNEFWDKGVIILGSGLDFEEVATIIKEFEHDPYRATKKRYIEIENGI